MGSGGAFRICVFAMFCEKCMENLFGELRCAQEVSCEGVRALREGAKLLGEVCVKIGVEGLEPRWARDVLCCSRFARGSEAPRGRSVVVLSRVESCDGLELFLANADSMAPTP